MITLIVIVIIGAVIWISIATKPKEAVGVPIGIRMIHGVLLPVLAFIGLTMLIVVGAASRSPDSGFLVLPFGFFTLFAIPAVLALNSLAMIPNWKTRKMIWLVGSVLPVCLILAEFFMLARYK